MKTAISYITGNGEKTALALQEKLPGSAVFDLRGRGNIGKWVGKNFHSYEGHIFIMSLGIVYRVIAPHITDKYNDPAVVVVDDARRFSIAALSGHEGGANKLAFKTAQILDNQPVVTTASDTNRKYTLGIGCRKGTSEAEILDAVHRALDDNDLTVEQIRLAASVHIKKSEEGLVSAFDSLDIPLLFIDGDRIRTSGAYASVCTTAERMLNLPGVSEPCALLAGRDARLVMERKIYGPVTIALAAEDKNER